jgi:small-conductance mechanosensitive channel
VQPGNFRGVPVAVTTSHWVSTAVIAALVIATWTLIGPAIARRADDATTRFYTIRVARYGSALVGVVVLALIWRVFHGRGPLLIAFVVAGLAFALQEVIGAIAGWFNILTGHIYRVGDRIEMAAVHGDVIDISLLRTKLLEFGSDQPAAGTDQPSSWVHGRQYTGRIVVVSNKTTFTEPVFNYSASLGFVWEEVTVPIPYDADWPRAEEILTAAARNVSAGVQAERAIHSLEEKYPVPKTEIEPRVFLRMTDNYIELAARFVVPVREARTRKSDFTRTILQDFALARIEVASTTMDITVRRDLDD